MRKQLITTILICIAVSACSAVTKTQKLDANAKPVNDLYVLIRLEKLRGIGVETVSQQDFYENKFKVAVSERLPQIFKVNGVPVKSVIIESDNQKFRIAMQNLIDTANTSHILVLSSESNTYRSNFGVKVLNSVNFNAELWAVQEKRIVWKAKPFLLMVEKQPLLRTQHLAGQLLNGMDSDGLIVLKQGHAIDLAEGRILDYSINSVDQ